MMALETRGVSVEETRAQVAEALALAVGTVEARAAEAEREYRQARGALDRFDRDYGSGDLSLANFERLMAKFTPECEAAEAQRAQLLAAHADDLRRIADAADDVLIGDLAALREAIAAHLAEGANADEVRFLLRRLFERFTVRDTERGRLP